MLGVHVHADKPSPFSPQFTALPLITAALLLVLLAFVNVFRTALVQLPQTFATPAHVLLCSFRAVVSAVSWHAHQHYCGAMYIATLQCCWVSLRSLVHTLIL